MTDNASAPVPKQKKKPTSYPDQLAVTQCLRKLEAFEPEERVRIARQVFEKVTLDLDLARKKQFEGRDEGLRATAGGNLAAGALVHRAYG